MALNKKSTSLNELASNKVLLEETFYVLSKKNTVFRVQLSNEGLCLLKESGSVVKKQVIYISDIIGVHCLRNKKKNKTSSCVCRGPNDAQNAREDDSLSESEKNADFSAYLHIYAYILITSKRRERTIITLRFRSYDKFEENLLEAQKWRSIIKNLINRLPPKIATSLEDPKKYLVFLNPKSGSGKARTIFQQRVAPILGEAEISYDLNITKHANFAREFMRTHNIYQWKGIVGVGGDGIFFEILNGIFERPDWEEVLRRIPLGIVPCGSGNGLAKSICHCFNEPYNYNPIQAASMSLVRSNKSTMDLVRVENSSQIMYSFLSIGWGLLADIDIESERIRAIGVQRFTVWSIARLLDLKIYKAKLWYLPVEDSEIVAENTNIPNSNNKISSNLGNNLDSCDFNLGEVNLETTDISFDTRQRLDSWYSANSRNSAYFSATGSSYQSMTDLTSLHNSSNSYVWPHMYGPASAIPALTAIIPQNWEFVEGSFIMVHASYQTHLGEDVFFAPNAGINDGKIHLLVLRAGLTRTQLLSFLLGLSSGQHLDNTSELIQMIPVKAFRLEPDLSENGVIAVDGEKIEYGPIQAEIYPNLAQIMVP